MYSWLPITQTLANSNQNRIPLDFRHKFTVILPLVTRTLNNSKPLANSKSFMFPLRSLIYNFTLDSSNHVLSPSKVGKKTLYWHPKHWILSFPLTSCMHIVSYWRLMLFVANLCETALLLKTVKPMLYLGNVLLLHYVLIYNLEVSFNFH